MPPKSIGLPVLRLKMPRYSPENPPKSFGSFLYRLNKINSDRPQAMTRVNIEALWTRVVDASPGAPITVKDMETPWSTGRMLMYIKVAEENVSRMAATGESGAGRSVSPSPTTALPDNISPGEPQQGESRKLILPAISGDFSKLDFHTLFAKLQRCNDGIELDRDMVDNAMDRCVSRYGRTSPRIQKMAGQMLSEWRADAKQYWKTRSPDPGVKDK